MEEQRPLEALPLWKKLLFAFAPLLLLAFLAHVTASIATHRKLEFTTDSLTGATLYRMRVGGWPWIEPTVTRLNTWGFPDQEFHSGIARSQCLRVVFAGDSFTFGDAVNGDSSWVSVVRDFASSRYRSNCVQVFNVAAPVSTIEQQISRIRETLGVLEPDIVVLGQYQNDITDLTFPGNIAYRAAAIGSSTFWGDRLRRMTPGFDSPLPRMITYRVLHLFGSFGVRWDLLSRWSVLADSTSREQAQELTAIYDSIFRTLVTELREQSVELGVVILPSKMDLVAKRYPEGDYFRGLATKYEVPYLELYPVLDAQRRPFPYQVYDGHLTVGGNRLVAEAVLPWLFDSAQSPFVATTQRSYRPDSVVRIRWWPPVEVRPHLP